MLIIINSINDGSPMRTPGIYKMSRDIDTAMIGVEGMEGVLTR